MPSDCLKIEEWRAATGQEIVNFLADSKRTGSTRSTLIVRTHLRPIDVYTYLKARFGEPNGFQNHLRKNDSDNWIHWDFNLKVGNVDIYLAGASREIHITTNETLDDEEWKALILAIKHDYNRVGHAKSEILRGLEKFVVFQNKYISISGLCAELHSAIVDIPAYESVPKSSSAYEADPEAFKNALNRISDRANKLYGNCLKLRLLTPIMAEAFINMIILVFCKDSIRNNDKNYQEFIRQNIPERLALLNQNCDGFVRDIDTNTEAYADFMRVVDKRNFALHGNVDPIAEQIEVVYFDGRCPLFVLPGHNVDKMHEHLEEINNPAEVIADYERVHIFLLEIENALSPRHKDFFDQVITDAYPGYEVKKHRATRILPDHLVTGHPQGVFYDDELKVQW